MYLSGSAPVRQCAVVPHGEVSSSKKADVIDLTLDSSSEDEEEVDPPHKRRCLYMSKTEEMHGKGWDVWQTTETTSSLILTVCFKKKKKIMSLLAFG